MTGTTSRHGGCVNRLAIAVVLGSAGFVAAQTSGLGPSTPTPPAGAHAADSQVGGVAEHPLDMASMLFVFMLATFIGIGVIQRVSRLLHTPLMSLTNAISAISVVGAIIIAGSEHYPPGIRLMGSIALFASMTNIVSGFLITDRMLKMFKNPSGERS